MLIKSQRFSLIAVYGRVTVKMLIMVTLIVYVFHIIYKDNDHISLSEIILIMKLVSYIINKVNYQRYYF